MPYSNTEITVRAAKVAIITRSIKEDTYAVARQWLHTFKYNHTDSLSCRLTRLMLASISKGDFKTQSSLLKDKGLQAPSCALSSIDYLSHASRIIIDYSALSQASKNEFLASIPAAGVQGVIARSATHAIIRKNNQIKELKGFILGLSSQLPSLIKASYDFGINIAMGGEQRLNLLGKKISNNGFSGHLYIHHNAPDELLMLGLEQTAPVSTLFEAFYKPAVSTHDIQSGCDQFGQGHSLTGASDVYTAAGSLYFSDPLYQAKLLAETHSVAPDKYGAMQVTLHDENWEKIKIQLQLLEEMIETGQDDKLFEQLIAIPSSASNAKQSIESFISLDFKTYLKRIALLLNQGLSATQKELQKTLLRSIEALQAGSNTHYQQLLTTIDEILTNQHFPKPYTNAIMRIKILFEKQLEIDAELKNTHNNLLLKQQYHELEDFIVELQTEIEITADSKADTVSLLANQSVSTPSPLTAKHELAIQIENQQHQIQQQTLEIQVLHEANTQAHHLLKDYQDKNETLSIQLLAYQNANNTKHQALNTIKTKLSLIAPIYVHIQALKTQAINLQERGYSTESHITDELAKQISIEIDHFFNQDDDDMQTGLIQFKEQCNNHIAYASPHLAQHRGWKKIVGNLTACILGLGVGYLIAGIINQYQNQHFLFFNQTKSIEKISHLETSLQCLSNVEIDNSAVISGA